MVDQLTDPWGEALGEKSVDVNGCVFNTKRNVLVAGLAGSGRTNLQQEITAQIVRKVNLVKSPVFVFDTLGSTKFGMATWDGFFSAHLQSKIVHTDMDKLLENLTRAVREPGVEQVFLTVTHTFNLTDEQHYKLLDWLHYHQHIKRTAGLPEVYLNISARYGGDSYSKATSLLRGVSEHQMVLFEGTGGFTHYQMEVHQRMLNETPWGFYNMASLQNICVGVRERFTFVAFMTEYAGPEAKGFASPRVALVRPFLARGQ